MTDEHFEELVNLYLDREIGEEGLCELRRELAVNPERKRDFEERCRLDRALRMAFGTGEELVGHGPAISAKTSVNMTDVRSSRLSALSAGFGLAAALVLSAVVFTPVLQDTLQSESGRSGMTAVRDGFEINRSFDSDSLEGRLVERSGRQRVKSLTAQLRLAGLSPETSPASAETKTVARREVMPTVTPSEVPVFLEAKGLRESMQRTRSNGFFPDGYEIPLVRY